MASRALVVGCDAYPSVRADLGGAVADALEMRGWLLSPEGGRLDRADVTFLASPSKIGTSPAPEIVDGPVTVSAFVKALGELGSLQSGEADRVFVYFAGHGCQTDPNNQALSEDAIVFTDFDEYQPAANLLGVDDVVRRLRSMCYGKFFVFVDACRNFPYDQRIGLPGLGFDQDQVQDREYHPREHVFRATLPGRTAKESPIAGAMRGAFTYWLIDGLKGGGDAKTFNPMSSPARYEVTWEKLREWVEGQMARQVPRALAEGNPVMNVFDDGYFLDVNLDVQLGPAALQTRDDLELRVQYDNLADPDDGKVERKGPSPFHLSLPPRRHRIWARAPDLPWGHQWVDAYVDRQVAFDLPDQVTRGRGLGVPPGRHTDRVDGLESARTTRGSSAQSSVLAVLSTDDPGAVIELRDLGGERVVHAVARHTGRVREGSYVARTLLPGRIPTETPVELWTGGDSVINLQPPGDASTSATGGPLDTAATWPQIGLVLHAFLSEHPGPTLSVEHRQAGAAWTLVSPRADSVALEGSGADVVVYAVEPGDALQVEDRVIFVPIHAGLHTSVMVSAGGPLVVRLVDQPLVGTSDALLLERAQGFAEAGQAEHIEILLDAMLSKGDESRVADALRHHDVGDVSPRELRQSPSPSETTSRRLPGQLWPVEVAEREG